MRLGALLFVVVLASCDRSGAKKNLARISADPAALDFGTRMPGESSTLKVKLTNTGEAELHFSSTNIVNDARAAFSLGASPDRLAIGDSVELTVTYSAPLAEGVDGAALDIESDADNAPQLQV